LIGGLAKLNRLQQKQQLNNRQQRTLSFSLIESSRISSPSKKIEEDFSSQSQGGIVGDEGTSCNQNSTRTLRSRSGRSSRVASSTSYDDGGSREMIFGERYCKLSRRNDVEAEDEKICRTIEAFKEIQQGVPRRARVSKSGSECSEKSEGSRLVRNFRARTASSLSESSVTSGTSGTERVQHKKRKRKGSSKKDEANDLITCVVEEEELEDVLTSQSQTDGDEGEEEDLNEALKEKLAEAEFDEILRRGVLKHGVKDAEESVCHKEDSEGILNNTNVENIIFKVGV
jgi:hypothetical protein